MLLPDPKTLTGPRPRKEFLESQGKALAAKQIPPALPPELAVKPASATRRVTPPAAVGPPIPAAAGGESLPADRVTVAELISHCALDSIFFCSHFFPRTFRQKSPLFHRDIWATLDDPLARYVNLQIQRDGAKTTLLRAYAAKRIAYGLSRTILYIGASQDKAKNSVQWLKNQIDRNRDFASTFGLKRGQTWTNEKLEILHGLEQHSIWVLAYGITGSVRGLNLDDYRPDLIIVDDVVGDDNSATPEQRQKIVDLVLGALKESLSPASETPDAKLVILNTPRDFEDLSQMALKDTQFRSAKFGCWTPETEDEPIEHQLSAWEERYPSTVLREEKRAAISRNALSIFAREKECRLITPETAYFQSNWLRYFGEGEDEPEPPEHERWVEIIIDPVPPPSEIQMAKGMAGKDYEAITAMARWRNKFYVLETRYNRGHEPSWTVAAFFEMCNRWRPRKVRVEAIAYQAALAWLLRQAMKTVGRYYVVEEFKDKRKKQVRIRQGITEPASNGVLFFRRKQATAISQFIHYPGKNPSGTHDDVLETIAVGCECLSKGFTGDVADDQYRLNEDSIPELEDYRGAP